MRKNYRLEDLFRRTLIFVGDLYRMDKRLDALRKEAKRLGVEINDLPESEKTFERLKNEANILHNGIDTSLNGER